MTGLIGRRCKPRKGLSRAVLIGRAFYLANLQPPTQKFTPHLTLLAAGLPSPRGYQTTKTESICLTLYPITYLIIGYPKKV